MLGRLPFCRYPQSPDGSDHCLVHAKSGRGTCDLLAGVRLVRF